MTIAILRPLLLLAILSVIGLAGAALAVTAQQGDPFQPITAVPFGPEPELPQVTAEESARAREVLETTATFSMLSQRTGWGVSEEVSKTRNGAKTGTALIVALEHPLDSGGPWIHSYCQETVTLEYSFGYVGITSLVAIVDADGNMRRFTPLEFKGTDPTSEPSPAPNCPEDLKDEEN